MLFGFEGEKMAHFMGEGCFIGLTGFKGLAGFRGLGGFKGLVGLLGKLSTSTLAIGDFTGDQISSSN